MAGRTLVAVFAGLLLLSGTCACSSRYAEPVRRANPADVETSMGVTVPITDPSAADVERISQREVVSEDPMFEYHKPASFAEAQRLFPEAMLPTETLGRRLIAIRYRATDNVNASPRKQLGLLYEGGLSVGLRRGTHNYPDMGVRGTEESTDVARVTAEAEIWGALPKVMPQQAVVSWRTGDLYWIVSGEGLTKEQVVKVARSLKP